MTLQERDKKVIWHPYSPLKSEDDVLPIYRGEGAYIYDYEGNKYIDAISSWWVTNHGHAHPYVAKKVFEQMQTLEQVIFARFTHEPAVRLAERLLDRLGACFEKVFYSDNGSTTVEVALKMCVQYWQNVGAPRHKVLSLQASYHGDTFGTMSVSERGIFNQVFSQMLFEVDYVNLEGGEEEVLAHFESMLKANTYACFIFEPLVQGAGGMKMYSSSLLEKLIQLCHQYDVLTIADEVMTGFGRTGTWFAIDRLHNKPNIICLSKCLTAGFMPMSVTVCDNKIASAFDSSEAFKTLYHGHSYTANPVACAAALANLDLMEDSKTQEALQRIEHQHNYFAKRISQNKKITNIRQQGTIIAMDFVSEKNTSYLNPIGKQLSKFFLEKGVLLRPLGNVLYILPPYCIAEQDLAYVYETIEESTKYF